MEKKTENKNADVTTWWRISTIVNSFPSFTLSYNVCHRDKIRVLSNSLLPLTNVRWKKIPSHTHTRAHAHTHTQKYARTHTHNRIFFWGLIKYCCSYFIVVLTRASSVHKKLILSQVFLYSIQRMPHMNNKGIKSRCIRDSNKLNAYQQVKRFCCMAGTWYTSSQTFGTSDNGWIQVFKKVPIIVHCNSE